MFWACHHLIKKATHVTIESPFFLNAVRLSAVLWYFAAILHAHEIDIQKTICLNKKKRSLYYERTFQKKNN